MNATKERVDRERQRILEEQKPQRKPKSDDGEPRYKPHFWLNGIYHDSYGWAWVVNKELQTKRLGKSVDVLGGFQEKPTRKPSLAQTGSGNGIKPLNPVTVGVQR